MFVLFQIFSLVVGIHFGWWIQVAVVEDLIFCCGGAVSSFLQAAIIRPPSHPAPNMRARRLSSGAT